MHLYLLNTPQLSEFFSCLEGILLGKNVGTPSGDIMGSILIFRVRGLYLYSLFSQSPSL
jgi:hypothetical protein